MKTYKIKTNKASVPDTGAPPETEKDSYRHSPDLPFPVGIDLHPDIFDAVELRQGKKSSRATVKRRFREIPTGDIVAWARTHLDPEANSLLIEATSNTFDCVAKLTEAGFSCVVVESNQVSKVADAFADDDQTAAERIARCYLTGLVSVVWVPDAKTRERRELLHAHDRAVCTHVRSINELKSFLTARNIRPGKRNLHMEKNRKWVESQLELIGIQAGILEELFASLETAKSRRDRYYRMICEGMLGEPKMLNALRMVGIGMINAFAVVSIVGDIKRFANAKKLVSYFGLNPGRKKSGKGKDHGTGVGNRGRRDMRTLLIQAAQSVLKRSRADTNKLAKWGFKLFARYGKRNVAVVAIARKLAHSLYYLLSGRTIDLMDQREPMRRKFHALSAKLGKEGRERLGLPVKRSEFVAHLFEKVNWPEETASSAAGGA